MNIDTLQDKEVTEMLPPQILCVIHSGNKQRSHPMIVAIHQPHFLPWLGYLERMLKADMFILLDHVQFEKQNYQNRVMIKTREGARWITVPVFTVSQHERIMDKTIDNHNEGRGRWGRKIYQTIQYA